MTQPKATNIVWHTEQVTRTDREELLQQQGVLLWFTGLSGSGKSTVANSVAQRLHQLGRLSYLLDGDNVRHGLNKDLGFTIAERQENIRRIGEVAKLFVDAGVITLAAFISPFRDDRLAVRQLLGKDFVEIFVDCALEVCEDRDPKGLYQKARRGEISDFTGISSPYEKPENAELTIFSDTDSLAVCTDKILSFLQERELIRGGPKC